MISNKKILSVVAFNTIAAGIVRRTFFVIHKTKITKSNGTVNVTMSTLTLNATVAVCYCSCFQQDIMVVDATKDSGLKWLPPSSISQCFDVNSNYSLVISSLFGGFFINWSLHKFEMIFFTPGFSLV